MNTSHAHRHRQLRLFISSTFADMNEERETLTRIFPQIKELCQKRDVEFVPLDLRWGITESAAKQGRVIETCLREIDNSRPFFIGIVGNRYGWVPSNEDLGEMGESIKRQYPWLNKALEEGMSITEMEMQYGALKDASPDDSKVNAAFYLRSDKVVVKSEFKEQPNSTKEKKLIALRTKIRQQERFPVREYDNVADLGAFVLDDLKAFLDQEYPETVTESFDKEVVRQEAILAGRSKSLFDLSRYDSSFDSWVESFDKKWLSVTGYRGRGKSYALAYFVQRLRKAPSQPVVIYFDWLEMITVDNTFDYILVELLEAIGVKTRKQSENEEMWGCLFSMIWGMISMMIKVFFFSFRYALGNREKAMEYLSDSYQDTMTSITSYSSVKRYKLLAKKLKKRLSHPIYVVLDNLDSMTSDEQVLLNALSNLPQIRLICSASLNTKAQLHLQSVMKAESLEIKNLYVSQARQYITNYLQQYGKALDEEGRQSEKLASSNISGSPELLSHILNLMVCFGSYEELDKYITDLSNVANQDDVFRLLIKNILEQFDEEQGGQLAVQVLMALYLVPKGLSEEEINGAFAPKPLQWAMIRPYVLGLCKMKEKLYYLPSKSHYKAISSVLPDKRKEVGRLIIDYFEGLLDVCIPHTDFMGGSDSYQCSKDTENLQKQARVLPWVYLQLGDYQRLYEWVTYIRADVYFSESERLDYWRALYKHQYTMRLAPHPDLSPALKRLNIYSPESPLIRTIYKDVLSRSLLKEQEEMYKRWSYVASFFKQTEDVQWVYNKAGGRADDLTRGRVNQVTKLQALYNEQKYDDIIAVYNDWDGTDPVIEYVLFFAKAFQAKGDLQKAFDIMHHCINLMDAHMLYDSDNVAIIKVYADLACSLKKQDAMTLALSVMEVQRDMVLPNGIDKMNTMLVLVSLSHLYFEFSRYDEALEMARLWQQSAIALNLSADTPTSFINKIEEAKKNSH